MAMNDPSAGPAPKQRYVRAVGPRLRWLLYFIFGLFAVLAANSVYLIENSLGCRCYYNGKRWRGIDE